MAENLTVDKLRGDIDRIDMSFMEINSLQQLVLFSMINPIANLKESDNGETNVAFIVQQKDGVPMQVIVTVGNESASAKAKNNGQQYMAGILDKVSNMKDAETVLTGMSQFYYDRFNGSVSEDFVKILQSNSDVICNCVNTSYPQHLESIRAFFDCYKGAIELGYGKKKQQSPVTQVQPTDEKADLKLETVE